MIFRKNIIFGILLTAVCLHANELLFLENLKQAIIIDEQIYADLVAQIQNKSVDETVWDNSSRVPLFISYPQLQQAIAHISLGSFPTPIQQCDLFGNAYAIQNLCIKHDSVSGGISADGIQLFGGNKVRKLEFLLADALRHNAQSVLTFGCIGSNHATATATYAQELGLRCYLMLTPQPVSPIVIRNLNLMFAADADIAFCSNRKERMDETIATYFNSKFDHGDYPYFIPTGGSVSTGIIGFVNAAFELRQQINDGLLSEPDLIYVPTGSCGTTAGLALGLKAAGIRSQIVAVCVEPEDVPGDFEKKINLLFKQTNQLLNAHDSTFPLFGDGADNVVIVHEFCGPKYGACTSETIDAIRNIESYENVLLDEVYSGKAFAALLAHAEQGLLKDKNVLFWNTFCSDVQ